MMPIRKISRSCRSVQWAHLSCSCWHCLTAEQGLKVPPESDLKPLGRALVCTELQDRAGMTTGTNITCFATPPGSITMVLPGPRVNTALNKAEFSSLDAAYLKTRPPWALHGLDGLMW